LANLPADLPFRVDPIARVAPREPSSPKPNWMVNHRRLSRVTRIEATYWSCSIFWSQLAGDLRY
jgi:hypothetical protein